ncbi:MAG: hypothetical protein Aureis2KO_18780 [Aureisphaera sp.]
MLGKLRSYHKDSPKLLVFSHDFIGEEVFSYGVYEKFEIETMLQSLNFDLPQHNMLDIGANIGNHSVQFSEHFKHVFSFEPNPLTFEVLKLNTRSRKNISIFNFGVSDKEGTSHLHVPEGNAGGAYVSDKPSENSVPIQLKPLDGNLNEPFAFIKIDVEGHEVNAFKGMRQMLDKNKPVICFELINEGESGMELVRTLEELGYGPFYFPKEPGIASKSGKPSFLKEFIFGFFFKRTYQLEKIDAFNRHFYNLVICAHPESEYQLKESVIKK